MSKMQQAYSRGQYLSGEGFIRKAMKGIVTFMQLVEFYRSKEGGSKTISQAKATATVLLSPRQAAEDQSKAKKGQIISVNGRGDCRGNFSAAGEVYFMEPLTRKVVDGAKEPQRFRWNWRKVELASHARPVSEVKSEKTSKKAKKTVKTVQAKARKAKAPKVAAPVADAVPPQVDAGADTVTA